MRTASLGGSPAASARPSQELSTPRLRAGGRASHRLEEDASERRSGIRVPGRLSPFRALVSAGQGREAASSAAVRAQLERPASRAIPEGPGEQERSDAEDREADPGPREPREAVGARVEEGSEH